MALAEDAGFVRVFPSGIHAAQFLLHYPGDVTVLWWDYQDWADGPDGWRVN